MFDSSKKNDKEIDFVLYDLFENILKVCLNPLIDDNINESNKPNINSIYLLFVWPVIVCKRLLFPSLELELYKLQFSLRNCLKINDKNEQLQKIVSKLLAVGNDSLEEEMAKNPLVNKDNRNSKAEKLSEFTTNTFLKIKNNKAYQKYISNDDKISFSHLIDYLLGGKPSVKSDSSHLANIILKNTIFSDISNKIIGNDKIEKEIKKYIIYYYIILSLKLNDYNKSKTENCINISEIFTTIDSFLSESDNKYPAIKYITFEILIAFCSFFFSDTIKFFIEDYKTIFLKNGYPKNLDLTKHNFQKDNPLYFASFYKIDDKADRDFNNYVIDVERTLEISSDYQLEFWFQNNLSSKEFLNLILLEYKQGYPVDLSECLLQITKNLSGLIQDFTNNYNEFISNAEISVDNNLDFFIENIDTIHNSYHLFSEYLNNKAFSRAIETLDMNLSYDCIEETRKIIKKKRKNHLQPELIQDLIAANKEISVLYGAVQRKHDAHKTKIAMKFFIENPQYFNIVGFDDIKDIDFSSNPNGIRDARRKIFYNIAKRRGKDVSGSKIAKELALE
jgi:hypothetical protein